MAHLFPGRPGIGKKGPALDQQIAELLAETNDPPTAIFRVVSLLQQALSVERVAFFTIDGPCREADLLSEAHEGRVRAAWAGRLTLDRHRPLVEAIQEGQPVCWKVAEKHLPEETVDLLAADLPILYLHPLFIAGGPIGFLAIAGNHQQRLAALSKQASLQAAVQLLALYVRTTGLQPDVLRPLDQVELLYEITTQINTNLSLEKVMTNILTQALPRVGATRGSIFLFDEAGRLTHRILARENLAPEISPLVIGEIMQKGLASWVFENKQGALIEDVMQDSRWMVLPDHAGHVRSAVAVPFIHQDQVQGMLFLTHPAVGRFRQEHLALLTAIAHQAAVAIQNARLYEWAENERRTLAAVLDSSAEAVVVTNPEGTIILSNPAARQALGIENRAVPLSEVLFHADLLSFFQRALAEPGTVSENVRLSDNRTFSVSVAPVRDREGRTIGRVAVMHDVTYLIELDEMKSRFVSTVSHDLKAPLTAIRGFAELIKTVGPLNEDQSQFVVRIREVVERMTRLVSSLLDLGKIEAGLGVELQLVNLREILVSSKYDMAMLAQEKAIMVDVEVPPDLPLVQADSFRLQQVLANLVGNAIKYTPEGGRVWIRAARQDGEVVCSVTDTGIGISPADLAHVFDKFYRCHDPRTIEQDGSGLGLAIVKSIIGEHGGRVWVESTINKGSTFYFSLPLREASSPSQTGKVK